MRRYLAVGLIILASPAFGLNTRGFQDAPITRLSAEELKDFRAFVMKTLDDTPDGQMVEWKAPKTRFTSKVTPLKTYPGGKCRDATIESDAHDRFQRGRWTFCKQSNGEWQFAKPPVKPK
jgi:surface antigen